MLSSLSVKKPFTVIVVLVIIAIIGVVAFTSLSVDLYPDLELPYLVVVTVSVGSSPEEVEKDITNPLEDAVSGVNNVKSYTSISAEHYSLIILEMTADVDLTAATQDITTAFATAKSGFPDMAMEPIIMKISPSMVPVMSLAIYEENSNISDSSAYLSEISTKISSVDGVSSVSASGIVENMIYVYPSEARVNRLFTSARLAEKVFLGDIENMSGALEVFSELGIDATSGSGVGGVADLSALTSVLTAEMMGNLIMAQNMSMPAGYIAESNGSYIAKVGESIGSLEELEKLPVFSINLGIFSDMLESTMGVTLTAEQTAKLTACTVRLTLDDVYDVIELNNAGNLHTLVNGEAGVMLTIQKQPGKSTTSISNDIRALLAETSTENENFGYLMLFDQGDYIKLMINGVLENLLLGALFAIIILFIFLREVRPTLVVGASIFISLLATIVMMYMADITMNIMSMAGLALGIGMLVDNSIVVIENIYRLRREGRDARSACIDGAKQVAGAITASTLTTVVVFLPIIFLEGMTKQLFRDIAATIAFSLLASLLVALTVVPMASHWNLSRANSRDRESSTKLKQLYGKAIRWSLNNRWVVMLVTIVLFVGSVGSVFLMDTEFFPTSSMGYISFSVEIVEENLPEGISTDDAAEMLLDGINENLSQLEFISDTGMSVGSNSLASLAGLSTSGTGTVVSGYAVVGDSKVSDAEASDAINAAIRGHIAGLPDNAYEIGTQGLSLDASMLSTKALTVQVNGDDVENIRLASRELAELFRASGVIATDANGELVVSDGVGESSLEYNIQIDKQKAIKYGSYNGTVLLALAERLADVAPCTTIRYDETATYYDVYVYSKDYSLIRYYRVNSPDGISTKVYIQQTADEFSYYFLAADGETHIPATRSGDSFTADSVTYTAPEKGLVLYYRVIDDMDLVTLPIDCTGINFADGSQYTYQTPLYKLLADEAFVKDADGNIIYREKVNPTDDDIPMAIAKVEGYLSISHTAGARTNTVSLTIADDVRSSKGIDTIRKICDDYSAPAGVSVRFIGQNEMISDAFSTLLLMVGLAVVLIYLVMVAQFQSLKDPFIIILTVPLAITGVILSIWIAGMKLSVVALVGAVVLLGIVVNNGIVFVDYCNKLMQEGYSRREALIKTGEDRIRPILMTALTTIAGLAALAFDYSSAGAMLRPMAVSAMGGLIYCTFLTLFFVPVIFDMMNKKRGNTTAPDAIKTEDDTTSETTVTATTTADEAQTVDTESPVCEDTAEDIVAELHDTDAPVPTV